MLALDVALACRGPGGSKLDPGALTSLDLRGKGVNAIAPSLGSQLTSLAKLDLADNVLGNECVKELASLKTLKHLSLANNELEGDALRPWLAAGGGASADAAALSGKKRKDAPQTHARRGKHSVNKKDQEARRLEGIFPSMRVLNVSGNGLVSVSGVAAARNLGALIANENKIQTLKHVDVLTNLNTIVASSNEIDELGEEFRDLVNLNKLSLSHNALETVGVALSKCKALRELRLAHNKIKTLPKNALADCVDLRVLDVSGNAFADFGDVEALKHLPKLQQLSMRGSPLSRDNKAYDKTVAKMCPSLKTLDGRRVGPGGWLDADRSTNENNRGDVRDRRDRADRSPTEKNAWADARAAAGLDPLEASEKAEPSEPSDDAASGSDDDDDDDEEEEMDDEEREMMAEVRALRASMRAEENARREKTGNGKARKKVGRDDGDDGDEDSEEKPSTTKRKKKPSSASIPGVSAAPGAEGTSFLQELVARNVGTVRESLGGGGEERRKTDDEKNAAATRSGVVKIVEVRSRNRRDGDDDGKKKHVVATGRDAFLALLGDGAETERDLGAWGGGGWGLEEDDAKSPGTERREKKKKRADGSVDDDGDANVSRLTSSSERKKKKKRVSVDAFDPEKKKRREDDPWNDEEARRRKKAMLAKKKKLNVLARRYKKA
jgi:hypothetical protein